MPPILYILIGVIIGLVVGFVLALLRRKPDSSPAIASLEQRLSSDFSAARSEMAERVEKMKGDLRLDLTERVQAGTSSLRDVLEQQLAVGRNEQAARLGEAVASLEAKFLELRQTTDVRLGTMIDRNTRELGEVKEAVQQKLSQIQADNSAQLEVMRKTVDEKLQGTLDQRLGESFKLVSDRLEQVHKGLGEMQSLASGVGDLKKVLTNVKTRGTWGEMQLGNLLEELLTPDQFSKNIATRPNSTDRIEFAIKLPGRDNNLQSGVWLPIDAKFPKEDYERLAQAAEAGDAVAVEQASSQLEARIRLEAAKIRDKYIEPPYTTDFAILYLPLEGLYAEVLRRPGLVDTLQRKHRVTVAGPTVFGALLNSLQMGFHTLAIEKRSSEVWSILGAVKGEFAKFGDVIERAQNKLEEATRVMDTAATRTRAIERKLRDVQELPATDRPSLIPEGTVAGK